MPKWIDLNQVDDDDLIVSKNRLTYSASLDQVSIASEGLERAGSGILSDKAAGTGEGRFNRPPVGGQIAEAARLSEIAKPAASASMSLENDYLDTMEPAKKSMTIFFLIDVSGSMKGTKIGSLNSTMEELLPSLIGVGEATTDVKIAVMKFSTRVEWVTPEPVRIEDYQYWNRLEAEGLTFMGDAFLELSRKLSRSSFLSSPSLSFAPVIFLLSDGSPNDDWKKGLAALRENRWFKHALKIALGIGSKVNMEVLREFTGNEELAVQARNADQLRELIKMMAITSSQIGSRSLALVDRGQAPVSPAGTGFARMSPSSQTPVRPGGDAESPAAAYEKKEEAADAVSGAKQQALVEEIRMGTRDILGEAVDPDSVDYDEGW